MVFLGIAAWREVDGLETGSASAWVRPDGRCSVVVRATDESSRRALLRAVVHAAPYELIINAAATDDGVRALYLSEGFVEKRHHAAGANGETSTGEASLTDADAARLVGRRLRLLELLLDQLHASVPEAGIGQVAAHDLA